LHIYVLHPFSYTEHLFVAGAELGYISDTIIIMISIVIVNHGLMCQLF